LSNRGIDAFGDTTKDPNQIMILDRGAKNSQSNTFTNKFNIWTTNTSPKREYFAEDDFEPTIRIQKKIPFEKNKQLNKDLS